MGAVEQKKTWRTKEGKRNTKKVKKGKISASSVTFLCCLKTTFFTATTCRGNVFEETHLFGLPLFIFFPPEFVNNVKITRACTRKM